MYSRDSQDNDLLEHQVPDPVPGCGPDLSDLDGHLPLPGAAESAHKTASREPDHLIHLLPFPPHDSQAAHGLIFQGGRE